MSSLPRFTSTINVTVALLIANLRKRICRAPRTLRRVFIVCFLFLVALVLSFVNVHTTPPLRSIPRAPPPKAKRFLKPQQFFNEHVFREARKQWPSRPVRGNLEEELWNHVKNDVVFGIKTGHEVAHARLHKLKRFGWWSVGRDVPNLVVIGDSDNLSLGVVGVKNYALNLLRDTVNATTTSTASRPRSPINATRLDMPTHWFDKSGWKGDKDKNLPALHLMHTAFPGKKWYILMDDDTYIFLENFARYILQDGMDDAPVYTGKIFYISRCGGFAKDGTWVSNRSKPKGMFAHGGSGIIINRKAMDVLYPRIGNCIRSYSSCWAGDMQVGLCLREGGVLVRPQAAKKPFELHFIPFWPSKALSDRRYSRRWKSEEEPITFHKIPDREQELMSDLERAAIESGDTINYTDLRVHLMSHGIVPCHTEHNKKTKYYSTEFMPPHLK